MGEEIKQSHFTAEDFARYKQQLVIETDKLQQIFAEQQFVQSQPVSGFELEAWLVDDNFRPLPINDVFLKQFDNPLASPELASFNIEVNTEPRLLQGHVFSAMHQSLNETWAAAQNCAAKLDARLVMCGILPTLLDEDLSLAHMSNMVRYRVLNREVIQRRRGIPMTLDINGVEHLKVVHRDVMLESAATSFQIHMQVNQQEAVRVYNASQILCAPMMAVSANSPYLFGKDLWDETRIPLFEQAVAIGGYEGAAFGPIHRVTFGSGYVKQSLMECFNENLAHYPILLPEAMYSEPQKLPHLRLHNGTIWRWNRPLIGFDAHGQIHLRIEHRIVPAGPSTIDAIANAAFYYGLVSALAQRERAPESQLAFSDARDNFYRCAQLGLRAQVQWLDNKRHGVAQLLETELLPLAYAGLESLDIAPADIKEYLGVIRARLKTRSNGSNWQRAFVAKHGRDMGALTAAYYAQQHSGNPVHEWTV